MFKWLSDLIFGSKQKRDLKKYWPLVELAKSQFTDYVEQCGLASRLPEPGQPWPVLTAEEKAKVDAVAKPKAEELKKRVREDNESLDALLPEAFALVKLACWRMCGESWTAGGNKITWDMVPFDVQLMGGAVIHCGCISEMGTGEGKTLVCVAPAYLNGLTGKGVHVITVNDYLAKRDSKWMGPIYEYLGLTVGCIDDSDSHTPERRAAYRCDITYGTNNEFGFDYLRDNMALNKEQLVQRPLNFVIVDEVDSILIDEARTPLIISGPVDRSTHQYDKLVPLVRDLVNRQVHLVQRLVSEVEELLAADPEGYDAGVRLVQAHKAAPKHPRYAKLRSVPTNQRLQERIELEFMRDKRMPELEADLFFVVDEKGYSVTLTDKGREALNPQDPSYWVLPEMVEEFAAIEGATVVNELDRKRAERLELLPDAELKRRKIKACSFLSKAEQLELMRAVSCLALDEKSRTAAIEKIRAAAKARLESAAKNFQAQMRLTQNDLQALAVSEHWKRRTKAILRLRRDDSIPVEDRERMLRRVLSIAHSLGRIEDDILAEVEALGPAPEAAAAAKPLVLQEEFIERKVLRAQIPDILKTELVRILRWGGFSPEERAEAIDRYLDTTTEELSGAINQFRRALKWGPGTGAAAVQPIEAMTKGFPLLLPQEKEELLKLVRAASPEADPELECVNPVVEKALARLLGFLDAARAALQVSEEEKSQYTPPAEPTPMFPEEFLAIRFNHAELLDPATRGQMIRALWETSLTPDERNSRLQQAADGVFRTLEGKWALVLASTTLAEKDRELFANANSTFFDEELIAKKIALSADLDPAERAALLKAWWMPNMAEDKRKEKIRAVFEDASRRLGGRKSADALAAEILSLTDAERGALPAQPEPPSDERLRERKLKALPFVKLHETIAFFQAWRCPDLTDEERNMYVEKARKVVLDRIGNAADQREALDACFIVTEEDRRTLPARKTELLDDEIREAKVRGCAYFTEEEANLLLRAIWSPEADKEARDVVIDEVREAAKNRRRLHFDAKANELHNISQLLVAFMLKERDVDYVVEDNKVVIVDEFTGRKMQGRRWSDGLHQAVEAKEGVVIEKETQTLATVTIQNYFRMYKKLSGMTGTAETEAGEFSHTYNMDVVVIPPNRPSQRADLDDVIYLTRREKFDAVVQEIRRLHDLGLPILVGTVSVETSEHLSRLLKKESIPHNVLNAKNHTREAEIVREAGLTKQVTIATNMAGRGTDIKLGPGVRDSRKSKDENGVEQDWPGGLQIIGTERHEARRIDRQLRGRAGRQGDPGSSRFFISLEDDLMRLFGSERLSKIMVRLGIQEGEPIVHPWVSKAIGRAQKKVEEQNFERRKKTLQYDNVMNKQRTAIYGLRRELLTEDDLTDTMLNIFATAISDEFASKFGDPDEPKGAPWNLSGLAEWLQRTVVGADFTELRSMHFEKFDDLMDWVMERVSGAYKKKAAMIGEGQIDQLARYIALRSIDEDWQDHLLAMDDLRDGIHLRAYAQREPLVEYTRDATRLFNEMMAILHKEILERFFRAQIVAEPEAEQEGARVGKMEYQKAEAAPAVALAAAAASAAGAAAGASGEAPAGPPQRGAQMAPPNTAGRPTPGERSRGTLPPVEPPSAPKQQPVRREAPKVGPNDPCPCGSGKKYKKCCGNTDSRRRDREDSETVSDVEEK